MKWRRLRMQDSQEKMAIMNFAQILIMQQTSSLFRTWILVISHLFATRDSAMKIPVHNLPPSRDSLMSPLSFACIVSKLQGRDCIVKMTWGVVLFQSKILWLKKYSRRREPWLRMSRDCLFFMALWLVSFKAKKVQHMLHINVIRGDSCVLPSSSSQNLPMITWQV